MISWHRFKELPGDSRINFEKMWRHLVMCRYGSFGVLREWKNMPGVEFVLELTKDCPELGTKGDRIAWQCKFVDETEEDGSPSSSAKAQFAKSLAKASGCVKILLCTNASKILKDDCSWIAERSAELSMPLEWRIDEDVENLFKSIPGGDVLREVYFGELTLTAEELFHAYNRSIEPVKHRYNKEVFTLTHQEQSIRMSLFERMKWNKQNPKLSEDVWCGRRKDEYLLRLSKSLTWLKRKIDNRQPEHNKSDFFDSLRRQLEWRAEVRQQVIVDARRPLIGVMADAGCGKTCLGISLAGPLPNVRPAGAFFLAKDFELSGIQGLAETFHFRSRGACSFDEVLATLDVVGRNIGVKMPIVIDGLNECSKPDSWKPVLSRLSADVVEKYPHVVIIVTYRSGQPAGVVDDGALEYLAARRNVYRELCIPHQIDGIATREFVLDCWNAPLMWNKYCRYYKINCEAELPRVLCHPLSMKLFCEAVNKDRNKVVNLQYLPLDTTFILEKYCNQIAQSLSTSRFFESPVEWIDVRQRIREYARLLFESKGRCVEIDKINSLLPLGSNAVVDWKAALREVGIGLEYYDGVRTVFETAYDALGGYLIADWMLHDNVWPRDLSQHALSEDIIAALIHLYARKNRGEYARIEHPELDKIISARCAMRLPDEWLSEAALHDIVECAHIDDSVLQSALDRVFRDPYGRFGVTLLERLLARRSSGDRDRVWGVFVERNWQMVEKLLWSCKDENWRQDIILAKWVLSSVCITLRDRAMHVLYDIGLAHPSELFDSALASLELNDAYVVERMVAVAYEIAMVLTKNESDLTSRKLVTTYAERAIDKTLKKGAQYPWTHKWILDSLVNTIALVKRFVGGNEESAIKQFDIPYRVWYNPFKALNAINEKEAAQVSESIHMDFENYSLTRLVGLPPYQTSSQTYKDVRSQLEQRMYDLGYRYEDFADDDASISGNPVRYDEEGNKFYFERFGKKYQLIAYAEMQPWTRFDPKADRWRIDPCDGTRRVLDYARDLREDWLPLFYPKAEEFPMPLPELIDSQGGGLLKWMKDGGSPDLATLLSGDVFHDGEEWLLLYGFLDQDRFGTHKCFARVEGALLPYEDISSFLSGECTKTRGLNCREYRGLSFWEFPWSRQCDWDPDASEVGSVIKKPLSCGGVEYPFCSVETGSRQDGQREDISRFACLPDPFVCRALKLHQSAKDLHWYDEDNKIAVRFYHVPTEYGDNKRDGYSLLFIRKDLLVKYCNMRQLVFVQNSYGERQAAFSVIESDLDYYSKTGIDYRLREFSWRDSPLSDFVKVDTFEEVAERVFLLCPDVKYVVSSEWKGHDKHGVDCEVGLAPLGYYADAGIMMRNPDKYAVITREAHYNKSPMAIKLSYLRQRDSVFIVDPVVKVATCVKVGVLGRVLQVLREVFSFEIVRWYCEILIPQMIKYIKEESRRRKLSKQQKPFDLDAFLRMNQIVKSTENLTKDHNSSALIQTDVSSLNASISLADINAINDSIMCEKQDK